MSKPAKKQSPATSPSTLAAAKPSRQSGGDPKAKEADAGSKQSRVIAMLQSPTGATVVAIMKVTGWQHHSVRGLLAGVVRKRLKLRLISKKIAGNRVYQITSRACRRGWARPSLRPMLSKRDGRCCGRCGVSASGALAKLRYFLTFCDTAFSPDAGRPCARADVPPISFSLRPLTTGGKREPAGLKP